MVTLDWNNTQVNYSNLVLGAYNACISFNLTMFIIQLSCLMKLHEAGSPVDGATLRLNQTPTQIAAFACQSHCLVFLIQQESSFERQVHSSSTLVLFAFVSARLS